MINITRSLKKTSTAGLLAAACVLPFCSPVLAGGMDEPWMLDDLKAQLDSLNNRVKHLENTYVQKGTELLWAKLSGHVNRAMLWAGNGHHSEFFNVDNDGTSSRFRLEAGKDFNQDFSVGTMIELGAASNGIAGLDFGSSATGNSYDITGRKSELFFASKMYGTLTLGRGLVASANSMSSDLSGTDAVISSGIGDFAGGLELQHSVAGVSTSYGNLNAVFGNDAPGRRDRVRYDTPTHYGFTLAAAAMDGGEWDAGLYFSQEINKIKLAAAIAYANLHRNRPGDLDDTYWAGSASILFPMGWNFTLAGFGYDENRKTATVDTDDRDKYRGYYAKLGYLFNWCQWGQTAFAVDYGRTDDYLFGAVTGLGTVEGRHDTEGRAIGAALVQNVDAISTELYLAYRNYGVELDKEINDAGFPDPDHLNAGMAGARIKF